MPLCAGQVTATHRVITALAVPSPLESAPEGLWDRIAEELQISPAAGEDAESAHGVSAARGAPAGGSEASHHDRIATVHQLRPRRTASSRWMPVLAAAAAGLIVGGAAVTLWVNAVEEEEQPPAADAPAVVGGASLEPVASDDLTGEAQMVDRGDRVLELTVDLSGTADPADGYFEVWLRDEEASQLISWALQRQSPPRSRSR